MTSRSGQNSPEFMAWRRIFSQITRESPVRFPICRGWVSFIGARTQQCLMGANRVAAINGYAFRHVPPYDTRTLEEVSHDPPGAICYGRSSRLLGLAAWGNLALEPVRARTDDDGYWEISQRLKLDVRPMQIGCPRTLRKHLGIPTRRCPSTTEGIKCGISRWRSRDDDRLVRCRKDRAARSQPVP